MSRHVNAISNRLSLRPPQRESLEILHRVCELISIRKHDIPTALEAIKSEYPTVTSFEREFTSLCFALATGVGKTRLMGAFITYLHVAHGIRNFFILAPNLTIYNKLIDDFTEGNPKYVFKGISEFATEPPEIITGDNYERAATIKDFVRCKINIFNISKINSEVRGGKSAKIKRLSEYLGQSYFDYLAGLEDLVMLMDESHRYRASAGVRAINELKPILGLELTATPFVETSKGPNQFKNVIYDYPLGRAIADGFVKVPAVATRSDFIASGKSPAEIETIKLEDGVRLHETIKAELTTYARVSDRKRVKPFVLVIARDTTHAASLLTLIQSDEFFNGRYAGKVIQVDSSTRGKKEDAMIQRLLQVESPEEPTEIVIHVNMLKEGWDVTNLYTIIPLRAANAKTLVEQSIGRGLRLPYGQRTGETVVDRLNIVAHDKFQEIVDEASRPDSVVRLQKVIIEPEDTEENRISIVSEPNIMSLLGQSNPETSGSSSTTNGNQESDNAEKAEATPPAFVTPEEQAIARLAYQAIQNLERQPQIVPTSASLESEKVQQIVREKVEAQYKSTQLALKGIGDAPDVEAIIAKTTSLVIQQTIDIPRIILVPTGEVKTGIRPFTLNLDGLSYSPPSEEMLVRALQSNEEEVIGLGDGNITESRLEDYVVAALMDFDDISYDAHADLLYDLAGQIVNYFLEQQDEEETQKILSFYRREIAKFIHAQMEFFEEDTEYRAEISRGFTALKPSAYTTSDARPVLDFRSPPEDKSKMRQYLFGGFSKCLYKIQKFETNGERMLSVILEKDAIKWFRPARGQFRLYYRYKRSESEYQPDFVAETEDAIYMLEPKMSTQLDDPEVIAKKEAAVKWCAYASEYNAQHGGKPWRYILIPHDAIAENMTLKNLVARFTQLQQEIA